MSKPRIIRPRAQLRPGLAGDGTDVGPSTDEHGGYMLNATMYLCAQAILEPPRGEHLSFAAEDRQQHCCLDVTRCTGY